MEAGRLSERVEFRTHVRASDGAGGYTLAEQPLVTKWALVESVRTSARVEEAGEPIPLGRYRIVTRYDARLRAGMTAVWRGLSLEVLSVMPRYHEGLVELEAAARLEEDAA